MPLATDIGHCENQVLRDFPLNRQVILLGILRPRVLCRLTEQQNRAEALPIHRLTTRRVQDAVERVGEGGSAILTEELRVELGAEDERAADKRWLCAELLQNELLHRIVENAIAGSNAALSGAAEQLAEKAVP